MNDDLSPWEKYKKSLGETRPWHLLDRSQYLEDSDKIQNRLDICKQCPELIHATNQCKKCGCFMHLKTKLKNAVCPLEKW